MLRQLRPLPKAMQGVACSRCDRPQACWEHSPPGAEACFVCALCVLYDPKVWNENMATLLTQVEAGAGRMFDRHPSALLVNCADADRVVGVAVLTDRVAGVRERSERIHRGG